MSELAPYTPPGSAEIDYTWNLANKLCKTEFVPANLRNRPEATLAVFLTGRELGIGPMQSLRDIYPINGRPALMASLMVARVRGLGHRFKTLESTDTSATVQIHRKGDPEPEPPITFTIADAKRAGLLDKAIWRQYPKAMHWNRAASAACRRDCPEALGGAVYTPEEIEDGNGATTATWGAPEPSDPPGSVGAAPGPPAGPGPTAEAGWRAASSVADHPDASPASGPRPPTPTPPPAASTGANHGEVEGGDANNASSPGTDGGGAGTPPGAHSPGASGGTKVPAGGRAAAPKPAKGSQAKSPPAAGRASTDPTQGELDPGRYEAGPEPDGWAR
jgi:hypothetical protein